MCNLKDICFGTDSYNILPHSDDWSRFGQYISKSTNLKLLTLNHFDNFGNDNDIPEVTLDQYEQLCRNMADNKSIDRLAINQFPFSGDEIPSMIPFLKNNKNLVTLDLGAGGGEIDLEGNVGKFLVQALGTFDTLRFFECSGTSASEMTSVGIVKALSGHKQLIDLRLDGVLEDYTKSYEALADLIHSCWKLRKLVIHGDAIGERGAAILAVALASTKFLKTLELNMTEIGQTGWYALSTLLMSKISNINNVSFMGGWTRKQISADTLSSMAYSLGRTNKIKKLNLQGNRYISFVGWKSFFDYVGSSGCALEHLDISDTHMDNERISPLLLSLANNTSLTSLNISRNSFVNISHQWVAGLCCCISEPWLGVETSLH